MLRKSSVKLGTGGGIEKFKNENQIHYLKPLIVFPVNPDPQSVF